MAIKIHKSNHPDFTSEAKEIIMTEIRTMLKLQPHPNLVSLKDFIDEATVEKPDGTKYPVSCVVVQELAKGGEVVYYVLNSGHFSESLARYFFI